MYIWGIPKSRGTIWGVLIIRITRYWGLYWVPLFWEITIHIYIYIEEDRIQRAALKDFVGMATRVRDNSLFCGRTSMSWGLGFRRPRTGSVGPFTCHPSWPSACAASKE